MVCPIIIGCRTSSFSPEQIAAFRHYQPYGLAIFGEVAAKGKDAVRDVIRQFREAVMRQDAPAFIDQEGGAVTRLKNDYDPEWRPIPGAHIFAALALKDLAKAREAVYLNAQLIAADMRAIDITVNFAPVLDVFTEETFRGSADEGLHAASGDLRARMLGSDPRIVANLGRAFCDGLMNQGVIPVIKHIPGYGRVKADPHYTITKVDLPIEQLSSDFLPFNVLNDMPAAMTGHVTFTKIDPENSVTLSSKMIGLIRDHIGFKNVLITDAIEMNAIWPEAFSPDHGVDQFGMPLPLPGMIGTITKKALVAGCDLVLHGDGSRDFAHTLEMLEAGQSMTHAEFTRINNLMKPPTRANFDRYAARDRLKELLQ